MPELSLNGLFIIAESTPLFVEMEENLIKKDLSSQANALSKFQEDVGVEIHRKIHGFNENEVAMGPISAVLNSAYEEVTIERSQKILINTYDALSNKSLKMQLKDKMLELKIDISKRTPDRHNLQSPKLR